MKSDTHNLILAESPEAVDAANRDFYAMFPYPWPPMTFPRLDDQDFETVMLNQSIGDCSHRSIPRNANIWVAGCGTNQAVYTARCFPKATIVGSDLSSKSLDIAAKNAATLGISNLILRQESLNEVNYRDEFDYVISMGVIHHNAKPERALGNIASALRLGGTLELMVYNRFHRTFTSFSESSPDDYETQRPCHRIRGGTSRRKGYYGYGTDRVECAHVALSRFSRIEPCRCGHSAGGV